MSIYYFVLLLKQIGGAAPDLPLHGWRPHISGLIGACMNSYVVLWTIMVRTSSDFASPSIGKVGCFGSMVGTTHFVDVGDIVLPASTTGQGLLVCKAASICCQMAFSYLAQPALVCYSGGGFRVIKRLRAS